ncbi:MAG: hypothetical protein M3Z15_03030 [Pseudomonadota bacterium]|nr:hypothetical protein [Pseudomonadota bacterium]
MTSLPFRAYFVLVGLFALWVGTWGLLLPTQVERALPWPVPPLHARFIAAFYLGGALAMALAALARRLAEVRIAIALAVLWTGLLLLVSLLHLDGFDFAKPQVWFWMGAYAVYPLWGAWLYRRAVQTDLPVHRAADPALLAIAAVALAFGAELLLAPAAMVRAWPWPVSPLLAHIYAGPFLAYGASALLLAREARPEARRIVLASMLAFTLLALLASLLHLRLFHFDMPSAWLWFAAFAITSALVALRLAQTTKRAAEG